MCVLHFSFFFRLSEKQNKQKIKEKLEEISDVYWSSCFETERGKSDDGLDTDRKIFHCYLRIIADRLN